MATYAVGDVQGCFATFQKLLKEISFDYAKDQMILLGDVLNRGPRSLEMLSFVAEHQDCFNMVLGNHDIFALALWLGVPFQRNHTLDELFKSKEADSLIGFLRKQPLIIRNSFGTFVHAGILPCQTIEEAEKNAKKLSLLLQGPQAKRFLERFYEKTPVSFKPDMRPKKALRCILASLTLLRMCETPDTMDLSYTGAPDKAPKRLSAWFDLREAPDKKIYFGHWAALGLFKRDNYYCLDSGCAWGEKLTALRLEDETIFQVKYCD